MVIIQSLTRYGTRAKYFFVYYKFKFDGEILRNISEIGACLTIKIKGGYIDTTTTAACQISAIASYAVESNSR